MNYFCEYIKAIQLSNYSFTEENYLKTIYSLLQAGNEWVSTNALAESTSTRAASVTDMLKRLSEKQLIHYQKYRGVTLTQQGELEALRIIRKHRLWEVFLVEKLKFGWEEVHVIAEELEHVRSERLVEKLNDFLNNPRFDPHGDPIPDAAGKMPTTAYQKLSDKVNGQTAIMTGVSEYSTAFLQHLQKIGLSLGCQIEVKEINEYDKSMLLLLNSTNETFLSNEVARCILVK